MAATPVEESWQMLMVAWRTIATSEGGGSPYRQVSPFGPWLFYKHKQLSHTVFIHASLIIMLPLEVVGPGGSLSMLLSPRLNGEMPAESPRQAATATAAYSCDRTIAALHLWLGLGLVVAAWQWRIFAPRWIPNFVVIFIFITFSYLAFSYQKLSKFVFFVIFGQ
jgi:hypothetical protein